MKYQICTRCICDSTVSGISFDKSGECSYCRMHDSLDRRFPVNAEGKKRFDKIIKEIKKRGKGKRYDCVVGVSGGRDSIYSLYMATKLGLRPLAVHFDNGWVSDTAKENIRKAIKKLDAGLVVYRFDRDIRKLYKACLKASVPEVCLPCSAGVYSALYSTASREKIGYIIIAISFRTEGVNPVKENYFDGRYFDHISRKHAGIDLKDYNRIRLFDYVRYMLFDRIKIVQFPFYMEYNNDNIDRILKTELDWTYGGRHHFDCKLKPFVNYLHVNKFGFDERRIAYSAMVRSGHYTREEALEKVSHKPVMDDDVKYCLDQMNLSEEHFARIMSEEPKSFLDYPTYYSLIKPLKPLFKVASRMRVLPETTYEKFFGTMK